MDNRNESPDDVLSPTEVELDGEHVRQLEDGRYVITTDNMGATQPDSREVRESIREEQESSKSATALTDLDGKYALVASMRTGMSENTFHIDTNDVSEAFESLLRWYARQVAGDRPPEEVIEVLLANSDL